MRCVNLSNLCDCVCMHMYCCPVIALGRRVCVNLPNTTVCVCVCVCVVCECVCLSVCVLCVCVGVGVHKCTCNVLCTNTCLCVHMSVYIIVYLSQ